MIFWKTSNWLKTYELAGLWIDGAYGEAASPDRRFHAREVDSCEFIVGAFVLNVYLAISTINAESMCEFGCHPHPQAGGEIC